MDLGSIIKEVRKSRKYTQCEFAKLCKISQTYLSQIENNKKDPNISTLKIIANHLNIPLPILFFKALTDEDISEAKKESFETISPIVKNLIKSITEDD
jgi:transcriptional regulator with XRE-family HTH domain